jgi:hypothetical protein
MPPYGYTLHEALDTIDAHLCERMLSQDEEEA